jgi:hypothetical protein
VCVHCSRTATGWGEARGRLARRGWCCVDTCGGESPTRPYQGDVIWQEVTRGALARQGSGIRRRANFSLPQGVRVTSGVGVVGMQGVRPPQPHGKTSGYGVGRVARSSRQAWVVLRRYQGDVIWQEVTRGALARRGSGIRRRANLSLPHAVAADDRRWGGRRGAGRTLAVAARLRGRASSEVVWPGVGGVASISVRASRRLAPTRAT